MPNRQYILRACAAQNTPHAEPNTQRENATCGIEPVVTWEFDMQRVREQIARDAQAEQRAATQPAPQRQRKVQRLRVTVNIDSKAADYINKYTRLTQVSRPKFQKQDVFDEALREFIRTHPLPE